jgi:hypothetical protein
MPTQAYCSHRYPLTHTTRAYSADIDLWRSLTRASPSYLVRASHFKPRTEGADPADNIHTLDLLAFTLFILLAKRSKASGLKVRLVLDIIAEDATWYFLVIFSSHLVLVLTLNLARVSLNVSLPESQSMMTTVPLFSQRSNSFQDRKLSPIQP